MKVDKPDAVILISRTDNGILLKTTHRRTAAYPLEMHLAIVGADGSEPIRYRHADRGWPAGTADVARLLDEFGVDPQAGRTVARRTLTDARCAATDEAAVMRFKVSDTVLNAALKFRRTQLGSWL